MAYLNRLSLFSPLHNAIYQRFYSIQSSPTVGDVFRGIFLYFVETQEIWFDKKVPSGYWKIKENQIRYMKWLSKKMNIKTMEDWYKVSYQVKSPN